MSLVKKFSGLAFVIGAALSLAPAHAEVLRVEGINPASEPSFATVHTIELDRFGGSDGQDLAFKLEDRLSGIVIYDQPYFEVMGGQSAIVPDVTLTGTATTGINEYETTAYRNRCIARDKDDKCTEYKEIEVDCLKREIDFRAQVRASRFEDGRRIYSESFPNRHEQTICFGDDEKFSSSESEVQKMIASAASSVRRDLAPIHYGVNVRVLESRKGMSKTDGKFFKAAVKMTKKDATEACRMWDEAATNGLVHNSLAFNRGLCAEMRGDPVSALMLYDEAQALSSKIEVRQGIERATNHKRALDEWDFRQSATSAEPTS